MKRKGNNIKRYILLSFLLSILFNTTIDAQTNRRTITGVVKDASTNETIPGASVWIKETTTGVLTSANGTYQLQINNNTSVLVVSFMGFATLEVSVGDKNVVDIALEPDQQKLDEAVVVAYGKQKRISVVGAITTLETDRIMQPTSKISNSLAGQVAGIVAVTRSGEPGSSSDFYIRGISTFGANQRPLVLVDGVERSLDYVDPEDVATFSILKDASATAVYGVRGANGVIIITTRKGFEGKPKIDVRAETGIVMPTKMVKMVNSVQFAEMYNEAAGYEFYTPDVIQKYRDGSDPDLYPNVDWIGDLYKDAATNQRINVNVSGGGALVRYYVAGSVYNEGSILKNNPSADYNTSINYNKINFRANLDINLSPSTVLTLSLANIYEKKSRPNGSGDLWYYTFGTSPNAFPKYFSNGLLAGATTGANPYNLMVNSGYVEDYWATAQSLVVLTQDFSDIITKGLKGALNFSWDASNSNWVSRPKTPTTYRAIGRDANGELDLVRLNDGSDQLGFDNGFDGEKTQFLEATLTYDRTFGKHRIGGLFLYNQKQRNDLNTKDKGDVVQQAQWALPFRNQGIAGRLAYGYDERYFFEFNAGYNGSENFSPGRRFGFFPSISGGWAISNESFFEPYTKVIDLLKLRASYGIVGNDQIGSDRRFVYESTVVSEDSDYRFGETGGYSKGRVRIGEPANPNVSWEQAYKTNVGFEISFFQALKLQVDYFYENREGIFMRRAALPHHIGLSVMPYVNVGKMKNQGVDGTLQYNKTIGEVTISAQANFVFNRNELVNNDEPDWNYVYRNRMGKLYGQQFGLQALGFFESQEEIDNSPQQFGALRVGDVKYLDINGDGIVNESDERAIGYSSLPQMNYGFGGSVMWRGFDVSFLFQGVDRVTFFMSGNSIYPFSSGSMLLGAINEDVYNNVWRTQNPNPNALYPRMSTATNSNNNRSSTLYQRDGSFIRLKNAQIGYSIPKELSKKLKINALRVYVTGLNLITFSKFKLWDPESVSNNGGAYPPARVISLGLNVNF